MMDPNLEKIRDANMHDISQGNIRTTLAHAKDYLYNILGQHNKQNVEKEMDIFAASIKQLSRRSRKNGQKQKPKNIS